MNQICKDRVVIITGAGRGIGREYALEFVRQGAKVVVNDLGSKGDGSGAATAGPAQEVVAEILAMGGQALANTDDVADWNGAKRMIDAAVTTFGGLDVVVNNAGILRDRTIVNMTEEDLDAVVRVHLRGTFAPSHHAAAYWRNESKAGRQRVARLINTSSSSGLYCNAGQSNYGAAKAGIASLTVIASRELDRYGVTVNAIYPTAMSRLTAEVFTNRSARFAADAVTGFDPLDPANVAPLVAWLGSTESGDITGRVFGVLGGRITVAEGWHAGPCIQKPSRWEAEELGSQIPDLVKKAAANALTNGEIPRTEAQA